MGREVRRVPLDFRWPLNKVWKGFVCPYRAKGCECGGSGYNAATNEINTDFYGNQFPYQSEAWREHRWLDRITLDELQALLDGGRLWDHTSTFIPGEGWKPKEPKIQATQALLDKVNAENAPGHRGMGHDGINCAILVRTRATRLGVYGLCPICNGTGCTYDTPELKTLADEWTPEDPPSGSGWQVWETVSEGSPESPVFPNRAEFIQYLVSTGHSFQAATKFAEKGVVPSGVLVKGVGMFPDIFSAGIDS